MQKEKIFLNKDDAEKLSQYCRGCLFFNIEKPVSAICNIIDWYKGNNLEEIIEYVKDCPCNKKCLVKVTCLVETCPSWFEYVNRSVEKRTKRKIEKELRIDGNTTM